MFIQAARSCSVELVTLCSFVVLGQKRLASHLGGAGALVMSQKGAGNMRRLGGDWTTVVVSPSVTSGKSLFPWCIEFA